MLPEFEDVAPEYTTFGYWITNEEPELVREMLAGVRIKKGAAIASSGDMALFAVLPRISKQLVLVDHSYQSLVACFSKMALLERFGVDGVRDLFINKPVAEVKAAFSSVKDALPPTLKVPPKESKMLGQGERTFYQYCSYGGVDPYEFTGGTEGLRKEWHYGPRAALRSSVKKLDKVKMVHGDLADISKYGPFDFLYLSNAMEHTGRSGRISSTLVESLVRRGGLALVARSGSGYSYPSNPISSDWEEIKQERGFRSSWTYSLLRRKKEAKSEQNTPGSGRSNALALSTGDTTSLTASTGWLGTSGTT
jgi:hypothetical protein